MKHKKCQVKSGRDKDKGDGRSEIGDGRPEMGDRRLKMKVDRRQDR